MTKSILFLSAMLFVNFAFAYDDPYEIKVNPYRLGRYGGLTDIEIKQKYNHDPSAKYRGTIENDGSVRMRNWNGDRLRGHIDKDGYGKLRDQTGNEYRVKPKY